MKLLNQSCQWERKDERLVAHSHLWQYKIPPPLVGTSTGAGGLLTSHEDALTSDYLKVFVPDG